MFSERNRRDYRRSVEQRLFGGASIDQHVSLLNKVRSPRVGDRIDLDLRDYLVDALPRISERALTEAAQPLDDLEEHRRSVAALAATLDAIRGLLDVYGSYDSGCQPWMMDASDYRHAVRIAERNGVRLDRDAKDCGPTPWDPPLEAAFSEARLIVHEEFVLDDVLSGFAHMAVG